MRLAVLTLTAMVLGLGGFAMPRHETVELRDDAASLSMVEYSASLHEAAPTKTVFFTVDVWLDSPVALAAYQIEVKASTKAAELGARVSLVGVEGSGAAKGPYADPPYYDPAALSRDVVIIAALSTAPAAELPRNASRIARLHFSAEFPADDAGPVGEFNAAALLTAAVMAASDSEAKVISPTVELRDGGKR